MSARPDKLVRMADEELMALAANADADAFEVVFDRHVAAAYALAHRICGSAAAADDACQEAMMAAWRSAGRFDARVGSVRSWLLAITHNKSIDHLRRMTRLRDRNVADETAAERVPSGEDTQADALARVERERTVALLGELPEDQRRVIELSFYSGYSHSEIAELLEVPLGTVKGRMRAGLEKLRVHLQGASA